MRNASFCFLFIVMMLSAQAQAFDEGGLAYTITNSSTVEVTGRASGNSATNINIPGTVTRNGTTYSVTTIAGSAFRSNSLISVTIPDNVTAIGNQAFAFNNLASVTIGSSVTTIGTQAFAYNYSLNSLTIPDSVTTIEDRGFYNTSLTSVTIPDGVTIIGEQAFGGNDSLTSVTFLGNFGTFNLNMFTNNSNLTTITYDPRKTDWPQTFTPAGSGSVAAISGAFEQGYLAYLMTGSNNVEVTGLASGSSANVPTIPNTVTNNTITYQVRSIGDQAFKDNDLVRLTLGNSVTTIGDQAFYNNDLVSLTIPDSVTIIGDQAFGGNDSLTSVTFLGNFGTFNLNMFTNNPNLTTITYDPRKTDWPKTFTPAGSGSVAAISGAFEKDDFAYVITSSNTAEVTGLASGSAATDINIPDTVTRNGTTYSVTTIGESAFLLTSLTSVTIGNSVTTIGDYAFAFASTRISVTIGNSVTTIGNWAFYNNDVVSLTIPDSVTIIGDKAFGDNTSLTHVTFLGNFKSFNLNMFSSNSNLTTITYDPRKTDWPKTFTPAGSGSVAAISGAFEKDDFAYVITSSNTAEVTGLASGSSATEINIPNTVTSNGTTYSVTTIGYEAFHDNDNITSLTIPDSVTTIKEYAFYSSSLTSLTIPDSVTTIKEYAFYYNKLTSVSFLGDFGNFEDGMFYGTTSNLTTITYVQGKSGWPQTFGLGGSGSVTTTSTPTAPQITNVESGDQEIYIRVSVASNGGSSITRYDATCSDGTNSFAGTSSSSLITVSGLTNGVAYTCTVTATNGVGTSTASSTSAAVTPEEMIPSGLPIWLLYEASK